MSSPPFTPDAGTGNRPSRVSSNPLTDARIAKRDAAETYQSANTTVADGYTIRPAIGKTQGADNIGWELIAPPDIGPDWYLATRALCLAAIPRHRLKYA